jgi:hypothetical protein
MEYLSKTLKISFDSTGCNQRIAEIDERMMKFVKISNFYSNFDCKKYRCKECPFSDHKNCRFLMIEMDMTQLLIEIEKYEREH